MESKIKTLEMTGLYLSQLTRTAIVDVEFGSPMKNCLHYGICRVTIPAAVAQGRCPCLCRATIRAYQNSRVDFVFNKKDIPAKTYEKHFSSGFFRVDDAYQLPAEVAEKLGRKKYIIPAGIYPVAEEGEYLKITF